MTMMMMILRVVAMKINTHNKYNILMDNTKKCAYKHITFDVNVLKSTAINIFIFREDGILKIISDYFPNKCYCCGIFYDSVGGGSTTTTNNCFIECAYCYQLTCCQHQYQYRKSCCVTCARTNQDCINANIREFHRGGGLVYGLAQSALDVYLIEPPPVTMFRVRYNK